MVNINRLRLATWIRVERRRKLQNLG